MSTELGFLRFRTYKGVILRISRHNLNIYRGMMTYDAPLVYDPYQIEDFIAELASTMLCINAIYCNELGNDLFYIFCPVCRVWYGSEAVSIRRIGEVLWIYEPKYVELLCFERHLLARMIYWK